MPSCSLSVAVVTAIFSVALAAQSPLATPPGFAGGNGGSIGGAIFFDLTATSSVTVTAFDLHHGEAVGTPAGVDVYLRPGTHVGFEGSQSGWNLASTSVPGATSAGTGAPTNVRLATPFCIPAGGTLGVALVCASTVGHDYTNGDATCSNCTVSTAELTFSAGSALNVPWAGTPFTPRVLNGNIYYVNSAGCSLSLPAGLAGVVEQLPLTGTLSPTDAQFTDLDFLRWNLTDPTGSNANKLCAVAANFGVGGAPAIGLTPQIPGFIQLWGGSTPTGVVDVWLPAIVGAQDPLVIVPPGVFGLGDTIRLQGLVLEPGLAGSLPVVPTTNSITFTYTDCAAAESFDGLGVGVGIYPAGWVNGGGTQQWSVNSGGTTSASTGPTAAVSPSNYLYCETSSPATANDTFIVNTNSYSTMNLASRTLNFQLSRVGVTIGTLEVRMDDGSGAFATLLASYTGAEPSGLEWTLEQIPLPSPLPANVVFQFRYTMGASFTGDLAIDDFCLR